jgi:hypothetical protein
MAAFLLCAPLSPFSLDGCASASTRAEILGQELVVVPVQPGQLGPKRLRGSGLPAPNHVAHPSFEILDHPAQRRLSQRRRAWGGSGHRIERESLYVTRHQALA